MPDGAPEEPKPPLFSLGQTVMTRGVHAEIPLPEVLAAMARHQRGDWGEVCEEDWKANNAALLHGARLLSAYTSQAGVKFWIITEWDRSATTALLPDEY